MKNITYTLLDANEVEETIGFWRNTKGVHLHSNGEDTKEGIVAYLQRNPDCSFLAKHNDKIVGTGTRRTNK